MLAGSAIGKIAPKQLRITGDIHDDDAIVFLASSGVQTNGLSLCRRQGRDLVSRISVCGFADHFRIFTKGKVELHILISKQASHITTKTTYSKIDFR